MRLNFYLSVLSLVLLSSCKMERILTVNENVQLPKEWSNQFMEQDTTCIAEIPWEDYFKDTLLVSIIDEALTHNPDMEMALQRIMRNRVEVVAQRNAIAPEIAATSGAGVVRFGEYTIDGVGNFDTNFSQNIDDSKRIPNPVPDYLMGVQTTWEAGLWGRYKNRKAKAKSLLLASEEGTRWVQTLLIESVASSYYRMLALDAEIKAIKKNIELQKTAIEIIGFQKDAGRVNELGVKQFEAQLLEFESMLLNKEMLLLEEELRLNALLGRLQGKVDRKGELDAADLPNVNGIGRPDEILKNRMDIREMLYRKDAARADMRIAEAAYLPDLRWTGFFGINSFNPSFFMNFPVSMAYTMIGSLTAPVVNRNSIKRNYRNATAEFNISHVEYKKAIINAVAEINAALVRMDRYSEITSLRAQQRELMNDGVAISNELFATGYASYVEVLLMQSNRLQAEIEYIEALNQQFQSAINLYKALGGGSR